MRDVIGMSEMRMNEAGDVTCCHVLSRGIGTCQGGLSFPNPSSYPCLSARLAARSAAQNFLQNGTEIVRRRRIFSISTVFWAYFAPRSLSGLQNQPIKAPRAKIFWNLVQTSD